MYCYGGNNPVRYTDPDGRAVYSFKYGESKYGFYADVSIYEGITKKTLSAVTSEIGGSFASFIGGIIGNYVGEGITKGVDRMCGFKELDTGSSTFDKLNSALGNILSVTGDFDKIKGLKGSYIKSAENISKVSKVFGYLFTAADLGTSIIDGKEVAKNTLIGSFLENLCLLHLMKMFVRYIFMQKQDLKV